MKAPDAAAATDYENCNDTSAKLIAPQNLAAAAEIMRSGYRAKLFALIFAALRRIYRFALIKLC
jgi:hypothetical protein